MSERDDIVSETDSYPGFDSLDYLIIKELQKNVRLSSAEVARRINANERTVRRHIDKLIKSNALMLVGIVNPRSFGYVTSVDVFIEIDSNEKDSTIRLLLDIPEISFIASSYGQSHEISIQGRFKDNESIFYFLEKTLPSLPGVSIKGYALVSRVIKPTYEWMPRDEDFGISNTNIEE